MKIEEMRIGGRYLLDGREVECVCLAVELHGGVNNQASYRGERDFFAWRPCEDFHPLAPPVKTIKARCAVAVAPDGAYSVNEIEVPVPARLELKGQVE